MPELTAIRELCTVLEQGDPALKTTALVTVKSWYESIASEPFSASESDRTQHRR